MIIDEKNAALLSRYLFTRMTKSELKDLCYYKSIPRSGTKSEIIDRLIESLTVNELITKTENMRRSISRVVLDSELLELRLSLGSELYNELFPKEQLDMLDWYEKLVIAILLKGPKNKSGIINEELFKAFLNGIDGEPDSTQTVPRCNEME